MLVLLPVNGSCFQEDRVKSEVQRRFHILGALEYFPLAKRVVLLCFLLVFDEKMSKPILVFSNHRIWYEIQGAVEQARLPLEHTAPETGVGHKPIWQE